jgi:hypothetical protein
VGLALATLVSENVKRRVVKREKVKTTINHHNEMFHVKQFEK